MLKNIKMKSTLKVDLSQGTPVIKIIQPNEVLQISDGDDYDIRDKILKEFLHTPNFAERNGWFNLATYHPHPMENPTVLVTTIEPTPKESLFYRFRHTLINTFVPYDTIVKTNEEKSQPKSDNHRTYYDGEENLNKINDFFDWLDKQDFCSYEERQP